MAFWSDFAAEWKKQWEFVKPRVLLAGAWSSGKLTLRYPQEASPGSEAYATIKGMAKVSADDEVLVVKVGDKPVVIGPVSRTSRAADEFQLPGVFASLNTPFYQHPTVSNSAATASTASTSVYADNVTASVTLPEGTWDVIAFGDGFYSHSSADGAVRVRMLIDSDQGTALSVGVPLNSTRGTIGAANMASGLSGTINISMGYRPNSSGTAYAGGGWLCVLAFRTA